MHYYFKNNINLFYLLILIASFSFTSFSQVYENQSTAVKAKMDLNKINGFPMWNGISTSFSVKTEGMNPERIDSLQQRISFYTEILSIDFTKVLENGNVNLVCTGGIHFSSIKSIFSNLVTRIVQIEENSFVN
jgi:hypothetical protein